MRLKGEFFFWPYFFLPFFVLIFFGRKPGYLPPAVTGSEWDTSGCFRKLPEEASMKTEGDFENSVLILVFPGA